jgi:hypothetical protein
MMETDCPTSSVMIVEMDFTPTVPAILGATLPADRPRWQHWRFYLAVCTNEVEPGASNRSDDCFAWPTIGAPPGEIELEFREGPPPEDKPLRDTLERFCAQPEVCRCHLHLRALPHGNSSA